MRFIRLVIILWLLMVDLVGGASLYGGSNAGPNRLQLLGFDRCGGKLCFWGILAGVTSPETADAILLRHGASLYSDRSVAERLYITSDRRIYFDKGLSYLAVGAINPQMPFPVTVEDVLNYLGSPCGSYHEFDNIEGDRLILFFPYASVHASLNTMGNTSPSILGNIHALIMSIYIYKDKNACRT